MSLVHGLRWPWKGSLASPFPAPIWGVSNGKSFHLNARHHLQTMNIPLEILHRALWCLWDSHQAQMVKAPAT